MIFTYSSTYNQTTSQKKHQEYDSGKEFQGDKVTLKNVNYSTEYVQERLSLICCFPDRGFSLLEKKFLYTNFFIYTIMDTCCAILKRGICRSIVPQTAGCLVCSPRYTERRIQMNTLRLISKGLCTRISSVSILFLRASCKKKRGQKDLVSVPRSLHSRQ